MTKPTGRQETDRIQKRARDAAVRLFSRHGFEGTSVQAVADEIGTSKQALLYHFTSKEGLRQAVLDEMVDTWKQALPPLLASLTHKEAAFDDALTGILAFVRAEPAYPRFLLQELLAGARLPAIDDVQSWLGFAADFIRRGQREGSVHPGVDPEAWVVNAGTLILAALSLIERATAEPPLPSEDRVVRELSRLIGSSLIRPTEPPPVTAERD